LIHGQNTHRTENKPKLANRRRPRTASTGTVMPLLAPGITVQPFPMLRKD